MMEDGGLLYQAFIYLVAAVCSVPLAKRLGLGSVLGYLIAGVLIGPFVFQLVGDQSDVMHFAEFGVVMMLFLVGLELKPTLLWRLRTPILGMGGLQLTATTVVLALLGVVAGLSWQSAVAIGLILAMSSTAIVLQTLSEKGLIKTQAGQSSFSVLLFQDIAVIPILAALPLLALHDPSASIEALRQTHESVALEGWQQTLAIFAIIAGIIIGGHFLMRPIFRFIAKSRLREIFTAAALVLVIGIALAMQAVGLSPALGAFLAGVVLADSEYRHELESNIEPFKSLLLGLFFISVGASIDFVLLLNEPLLIFSLVVTLVAVKLITLIAIGFLFRLPTTDNFLFSFALAQGGEFAFVLFAFATQNQVLTSEIVDPLILTVAISMLITPILIVVHDRLLQPRLNVSRTADTPDNIDDINPVIIAGFGRFGQVVGRLLHANGFNTTVLDHDATQIELLRKFGYKVFYGDASQTDLLHAAGIEQAKLLVIAIGDPEKVMKIADHVSKNFPDLRIIARARGRVDAYELIRRGVQLVHRETFGAGLDAGVEALRCLGFRAYQAVRAGRTFKYHDEEAIRELSKLREGEAQYISRSIQLRAELEALLQRDDEQFKNYEDHAWEAAPPRGK